MKNNNGITNSFAPLIVAGAAFAGLFWSWGTWPDVVIDFGRELYAPWRLTEGDLLYRDIVYFNGPLSPYLIALWFLCFSVSFKSLVILNILIAAGALWLLYLIFFNISGRFSALIICLTFLSCFAFTEFVTAGNYNWISPYSHEMTHGLALSLLSLFFLFRFSSCFKFVWICGSGLALGLVFLTKAEIFLAASLGNLAGILALLWLERRGLKFAIETFLSWAGLALMPAFISYMLLSQYMSAYDAMRATMGTWPHLFNSDHRNLLYYKEVIGTVDFSASMFLILQSIGWYFLIFAPAFGLALFIKRKSVNVWTSATLIFLFFVALIFLAWQKWGQIQWHYISQPWQVFMTFFCFIEVLSLIKYREDYKKRPDIVLRFALTFFSLVLLAKMIFNVRIAHYGFVLALPATLMIVAALLEWIPQIIKNKGGLPVIFRAVAFTAWLITIFAHISISNDYFSNKKTVVGTGSDSFLADQRGDFFNGAIKELTEKVKPGETLAVLPEGIMLNYMLRLPSSTPFVSYSPMEITLHGEDKMLASFQNAPPDWIVLINTAYPGFRFIGYDYGKLLMDWILKNYVVAKIFGSMPLRSGHFGILILNFTQNNLPPKS